MGHIDIIIKHHAHEFTATAPLFPNCMGQGKTERTALRRLAVQIGRAIGKESKALFQDLLTSDQYTDLILNPSLSPNDSGDRKRVYPLFGQHQTMVKMANIKLPSLTAAYPNILLVNCDETNQNTPPRRYQHSFSGSESMQGNDDDDPQGYSFGFPLSFN
tara:strand:- start:4826 stop:5305 length:480 start_codon:yes stop_codon:yes gene_type:complete